jgi:hypothetical protein
MKGERKVGFMGRKGKVMGLIRGIYKATTTVVLFYTIKNSFNKTTTWDGFGSTKEKKKDVKPLSHLTTHPFPFLPSSFVTKFREKLI